MKRSRAFLSILGLLCLVASFALAGPPAEAAVPRKPITCGMTISTSMNLYLPRDLACPGSGLTIYSDYDNPDYVPKVNVDLRGHTLSGSGIGQGISAVGFPFKATLTVSNGRLKNWSLALQGDTDTRVKGVALVDNWTAFGCSGYCSADMVLIKNNEIGVIATEGEAVVRRSTFVGNEVGATVSYGSVLRVDRSLFLNNRVGMEGNTAGPQSASSTFVRNKIAVRVNVEFPEDDPQICAELTNPRFIRNGRDVVGPRC